MIHKSGVEEKPYFIKKYLIWNELMKDSFKNHYFLAQNFDNQALKLHLLQLQILLSEDSQYNFFYHVSVWKKGIYLYFKT